MTLDEMKLYEQMMDYRVDLERLAAHPAWKSFQAAMEKSKELSYRLAVESDNPHVAAKHLGAYHAIKSVTTWLARELDSINYQIIQHNQKGD